MTTKIWSLLMTINYNTGSGIKVTLISTFKWLCKNFNSQHSCTGNNSIIRNARNFNIIMFTECTIGRIQKLKINKIKISSLTETICPFSWTSTYYHVASCEHGFEFNSRRRLKLAAYTQQPMQNWAPAERAVVS